jgi:ABC-type cobalt transport system substrate-binding protein
MVQAINSDLSQLRPEFTPIFTALYNPLSVFCINAVIIFLLKLINF